MSHLVQNTPEWLEFRKNKLGASDAPIVMGVSPWTTPYQLWQKKLGLVEDSAATRQQLEGQRKEVLARNILCEMFGDMQPKVAVHPQKQWMMASADAVDATGNFVVEIKCPGIVDHQCADAGNVPAHYAPQLQHTLEVFGLDEMSYFSFFQPSPDAECHYVIFKVYRDDPFIKTMLAAEEQFMECIQDFKAPALTQKDYVSQTDCLWISEAQRWIHANEQRKHWETMEKQAKEKLFGMSDGKNCMGGGIKMTQVVKPGTVDYKAVPQLMGVDLEPYRKKVIEYPLITVI